MTTHQYWLECSNYFSYSPQINWIKPLILVTASHIVYMKLGIKIIANIVSTINLIYVPPFCNIRFKIRLLFLLGSFWLNEMIVKFFKYD